MKPNHGKLMALIVAAAAWEAGMRCETDQQRPIQAGDLSNFFRKGVAGNG
jgi:hypothetical protein